MIAFAIGAGIGSGLGFRMGSSQPVVYSKEVAAHAPAEVSKQPPAVSVDQMPPDASQTAVTAAFAEQLGDIKRRLTALEASLRNGIPQELTEAANDLQILSRTGDQQQSGLQSQLQEAGFSDSEYSVISTTRDQLRLKRLQLRDTAVREGWFGTDAWTGQVRELNSDTELRKTLGDERFDDYLLATGRNNRVKIDELMGGSAAEQAGLRVGDLIHRYADERVFSSVELRSLTTGGQVGENTALTVLRNGEMVDLVVPRGPLGVIISGAVLDNVNE